MQIHRSMVPALFAAAGLAGLAGLAQAEVITSVTTSVGNGADTYIQGVDSTSPTPINFGNSANLTIKNPAAGNRFARKPYLRFDLSGLPAGEITDASLSLYISANNSGGSPLNPAPAAYTISVYGLADGVGENWVEGNGGTDNNPANEIVWTNAPGNLTTSGINFNADATLLGILNIANTDATGSTVTFNATPELLTFLNADTDNLVTLMLARSEAGSPNLNFASKEFTPGDLSDEPTLNLTIVPEPGSLALLGLGGLLIARRRRG